MERFAAITGDVSSLHLDDSFARRSQYRRPVVHGMLPLAFLPLLQPFRVDDRRCMVRALTGQFTAPLFAGDELVLSVDTGTEDGEGGDVEFAYRVTREGATAAATQGTITVRYESAADPAGFVSPAATGTTGSSPGLLTSPAVQESHRIEEIETGQADRPLDFRVGGPSVEALVALLAAGALEPSGGPPDALAERFDLPTLLAILLFSTSVGVRLPGASATFLEFDARVATPLAVETAHRLEARVRHRSRSTSIVKKSLTVVAAGSADPLVEGSVAALVNPPAGRMPSIEELRDHALDLGLRGKVVVVTGASRGIGETIAKLFGLMGARVVVSYHRGAEDAQRVVAELAAAGAEALAVRADVTDRDEVRELAAGAVERFGTIDVLVNNAARDFRPIRFADLTWEEVQKDLDVIAKGAFFCCQEVIPIMLERGGGRIVNLSSLATEVPPPDQLKYVMAKSALVGLTRSLALELAPRNVHVNMVVPHFIETDLVAHVPKGFRKKIAAEIPMGRLGTPADVARAVVFLASDYSSFTTGQRIMVTGGAAPLL